MPEHSHIKLYILNNVNIFYFKSFLFSPFLDIGTLKRINNPFQSNY